MGTVRAGMPFSVADQDAKREMGHGFECRALSGRIRLCELKTDGPIGVLKVLVDHSGRAALIQFLVTDSSLKWIEMARQLDAEWTLVHASQPAQNEMSGSVKRWETDNRRWTAQLSRRESQNFPFEMVLADAGRLRRLAARSPSALLRLENEGMGGEADLAAAEQSAPDAIAKAADSLAADGAEVARKASTLPRCPAIPTIPVGERALQSAMDAELASLTERTIAGAYPGSRLVVGDRGLYLVDSLGAAEEISLSSAKGSVGTLFAVAVTFPRRAMAAQDAAKTFQTEAQCRAGSEIIVARVDPVTRAVGELQRVDVDGEALVSAVATLSFENSAIGQPVLFVTYLAGYGGGDWWGQVRWNEVITTDPLAVLRRAPETYVKSDGEGVITEGALVVATPGNDDPTNLTLEPGSSAKLTVLTLSNPVGAVRHVLLLAGPNGLASGWTLLSQL
ncbi:MAG TPA: hypothetical protein VJ865_13270 [Gemmatimonadaceae bacterium]|nr:hypothetical protein [Gemmatimonadaceae bacterium]